MSRTPAAPKNADLKPVSELAEEWGVPEDVIIRDCKPLLHLPEEAALDVVRQEPAPKQSARSRGRNTQRATSGSSRTVSRG